MTAGVCPGQGQCFALRGVLPCRMHGCRVCGACVLADTEDWPAPLCIAHTPEPLIDDCIALRRAVLALVEYFDGVHAPGCSTFLAFGRAVSDATIISHVQRGGAMHCTCGCFAVRDGARVHFGERAPLPRRDTDRAPPPSTPARLVEALERKLGGPVVFVETSWRGKEPSN